MLQAVALNAVTVVYPTTGSVIGGIQDVTWSADCEAGDAVNIYYSGDDFANTTKIASSVPCSPSSFSWNTGSLNGDYKIRIKDASDDEVRGTSGVFTIDNTLPAIVDGALTTPSGTIAGTVAQTIGWNAADITDAHLGATPVSLYYSADGGEWQTIASGLANSGSYAGWTPGFDSASVKLKIEVTDLAGNKANQESGSFAIDNVSPVGAISLDKNYINDADLTRIVTVSYNEKMDVASVPQIRFTADLSWSAGSGSWTDDKTWKQSFTFVDGGQQFHASIAVTGAKDAAGNTQGESVASSTLAVDTQNPTVVSASATPDPAKAGTVVLAVVFSEQMASAAPTVAVTGLTGSYSVSGDFATDEKTWNGSFTLADNDEEKTATISISGGEDKSGNIGGTDTSKTFKVDTVTPTVSSISFDTLTIYDGDLKQKVTVNFSEKMLETAEPQFVFDNTGYDSENDGDWNAERTVWTETFTFSDDGEEAAGVTATVSGAADLAGNAIASTISTGTFAIDTMNPAVVLTDDQADGIVRDADTVNITATFSEAVVTPTIQFGTGTAVAMTATGDASVWTFAWNVPNTPEDTADVIIAAKDQAGNDNALPTAGTPGRLSFTVDNQAPTVTVKNIITNDTTPTITGTVDDQAATVSIVVHDKTYFAVKDAEGDGWTAEVTETLADGTYDVAATATDVAGNPGVDGTNNELTIDTVAPSVPVVTSPVNGAVYKNSAPLIFTASDAATSVTCSYSIDGGAATNVPCTKDGTNPNATLNSLTDGWHTIVVTATDGATNSASSDPISFIVDTNNTLTVGATGADFTSIQAAIQAATSGDTIKVAAGTYAENVTIPVEKSGLVISGHDKADTFINAASGNAFTVNAPATIENFTIDLLGTGIYGVYEKNIAGATIQDNIIKNYKQNGVFADGGSISIIDNVITGKGVYTDFSADAIYTKGGVVAIITGNTLSGNIFENIAGGSAAGISIHTGDDVTATGNTIFGNSIGIHAKSGSTVEANDNKIYSNTYNFYFEDDNTALTEDFDLSDNWWGVKMKSQVAAKMFGYGGFSPWYLDEAMTTLSSSDTTDPEVEVTTSDTDSIVKAGDVLTIYATATDANGIDGAPLLTVGNIENVPMTPVSENVWKYESWTVPAGSGSAIVSVTAFDAVGNDGTGTKSLIVDNDAPTFVTDDGTATGPVKTDVIKITVSDANGITETKYGLSTDDVCDASDAYSTDFTSSTAFEIAGDYTDYICAKAVDAVGNVGYVLVGKLNTDNTAPAAPVIAMTDPVLSSNVATVTITGTGEANANIGWEIEDGDSAKISGTGTVSAGGAITIGNIDVTTLADGELIASVWLRDAAGNESTAGTDEATKDVQAPTIIKVSSDALPGNYKAGDVIDFDITFSESVTGNAKVVLDDINSVERSCSFDVADAISGTCSYTVAAGDNTAHLTTTLSGSLVDDAGNTMTVFTPAFDKDIAIDTEAPVIAPHENVTFEAASAAGAYVPYDLPTATDNLDESIIVTCLPASDTLFKIKTTQVTCTATDEAGNTGTSTFDVIVQDKTAPMIDDNDDMTVEATSGAGAVVTYISPKASDLVDTDVAVICKLGSDSTFPLGTTTVTCVATDDSGNSASSTFDVTVQDTTGPVFGAYVAPLPVEATGTNGVAVTYVLPTASDAVDGAVTPICLPASGSVFALGTTQVTCTATDAKSNSSTMSFDVTVVDTTAPEISCTVIPTVEATSPQGAAVEMNNCSATDLVDGNVAVSYDPASGSIFPLGETTVGVTATDVAGNPASTSFAVTVVDTTAPTISLTPANGDTVAISNPEIKAVFGDIATGIDVSSISMILDDVDVTAFATKDATGLTYKTAGLAETVHSVTVSVSDIAGNAESVTNQFQVIKSSKNITISSNKASLPADGTSAATITAAVTSDGELVAGATVKFAKTIGTLSATSAVTDAEGIATVTLVSDIAGMETVTATYGAGSEAKSASVSINFTEVIKDTTSPTVAAFTPADGAINIASDVNPTVTFSELMDESSINDINIGIRWYADAALISSTKTFSTLNGKTVVTIDPSFNLSSGGQYFIFVENSVKDLAGNALAGDWTANTKAAHEFTVSTGVIPPTSFVISLKKGWNLISLPVVPENPDISYVLQHGTTPSLIDAVEYYDAETGEWLSYIPSTQLGALRTMEDGKGYWINAKSNNTLTIDGTISPKAPASPSLYRVVGGEWNLIGFTSTTQKSVGQYITQMSDSDKIMAVDANGFYVPLTKESLLKPGSGYWFYTPKAGGIDIIPQ